jgi:hypothetical protein
MPAATPHLLVIQFPMSDDEDDDDLAFRTELEELAATALAADDLGACDGGDIGTGKINVFCAVSDPVRACAAIVAAMDAIGLDGGVIASVQADRAEHDDMTVLHPPGHTAAFSVL